MSDAWKSFEIDDMKSFDQNIDAFGDALVALDATLGTALKGQLKDLVSKNSAAAEVWDALLAAAEKGEQPIAAQKTGAGK